MPKALKDGDYTLAEGAAWIALDGLAVRLCRIPGGVGYNGELLVAPYLEIAVYLDGHETEEPLRLIDVPFPNP